MRVQNNGENSNFQCLFIRLFLMLPQAPNLSHKTKALGSPCFCHTYWENQCLWATCLSLGPAKGLHQKLGITKP